MKTIDLDSDNIDKKTIISLADALRSGKVLVFPTDTVPGLLADASNRVAVERIFEIKNRPTEKKFPIFVANMEMAKELAQIDEENEKKIKGSWPGPFTYILNRVPYPKELYGTDEKTIALRIPDYKPLNMLLEEVGIPLVQTSVNVSGEPALNNIEEIREYIKNQKVTPDIDIVVNTSKIDHGKPSQIIDLTLPEQKTIRS